MAILGQMLTLGSKGLSSIMFKIQALKIIHTAVNIASYANEYTVVSS